MPPLRWSPMAVARGWRGRGRGYPRPPRLSIEAGQAESAGAAEGEVGVWLNWATRAPRRALSWGETSMSWLRPAIGTVAQAARAAAALARVPRLGSRVPRRFAGGIRGSPIAGSALAASTEGSGAGNGGNIRAGDTVLPDVPIRRL